MSSQNKNDSFQISEIITDIIDNNNNNNDNEKNPLSKPKNQQASIEQLTERTTLKISSEDIKYKNYENKNTLNEPITDTILRDLNSIYFKLKFVINPFINQNICNECSRHKSLYNIVKTPESFYDLNL